MPIRCLIFTAILGWVLAKPARGQVGQPASLVVRDICPFECCHFGTWTARAMLELQRTPGPDISIAFTVIPGESFRGGNWRTASPVSRGSGSPLPPLCPTGGAEGRH
jgi:hypothetical protein